MNTVNTMTYAELKARQQKEINALPLGFAFGKDQFDGMMHKWGLDPVQDRDKIRSIGYGGYVQNKDAEHFHATLGRHRAEMDAAIAADTTGEGFIHDMFRYELSNHEYIYTLDAEETLDALGYTREDVEDDPRLKHGFEKAAEEVLAAAYAAA